ncbi:MAG: hypothetical protein MI866_01985 [Bacteroidales bacterium]|nr:hypothetical protein [Bacteroidales bacterium]
MKRIQYIFVIIVLSFVCQISTAQNIPSRQLKKDTTLVPDKYPYILPIMGDKVHDLGFNLPFPMGIMFNSLSGNQNLSLSGLQVGFGNLNSPVPPNMIDLGGIVKFDDVSAQTSTFNLRLDAWVFPFLNVYGIVGQTKKADINVNMTEPFPLPVSTEVSGTYVGYGIMAAGSIGPLFVSGDMNHTFSYNPRLDKPAKVLITGTRIGPVFNFKNKPDMNVVIWVGAMHTHFNGHTVGQINTIDLAPDAPGKIDDMRGNLNNWYDGLSPIDKIKYGVIYKRLDDGLGNLKDGVENSYIRYEMNKSIENPWNMLVGAQWQINKRWQVRAEAQFMGDRTAGLVSLNYRFGIKGKNWGSK